MAIFYFQPQAAWLPSTMAASGLAWTEETIGGFVVGLPVHADGSDSRLSLEFERFGAWLKETIGCPLVLHDERYSSQEAVGFVAGLGMSRRQEKTRTDSLATQIAALIVA